MKVEKSDMLKGLFQRVLCMHIEYVLLKKEPRGNNGNERDMKTLSTRINFNGRCEHGFVYGWMSFDSFLELPWYRM